MSDTPDLAEALLQCSTDCIKILDENAKVQFFNRNGLLAMEIDDFSAVANLYWPALWPEDVRPLLEARLAEARVSGVSHLKAACPTAKGTPKWWEITIAALPGSDSRRFVVISKDVTRQEELEANDRRSLDRMSVAFRNSADVMWDIDLTRNEVWWSEGIQSLFGYGADQVGSSTQWCHEHMHPDDRERVVESMTAAVANGDVRWESEFRYRKADGGYLEVHDQGAIVRDAAGKALRFVGTMKDVTARNAASAQERQMAAELAHRMNNTLAVITGIFHRSVKSSASIDELAQVFGSRLVAMATANSVLLRGKLGGADLKDLAEIQLAPYLSQNRLSLSGPPVPLPLNVAQALTLALNELATNALKYGALSAEGGTISLDWQLARESSETVLTLRWVETGGPPITQPPKRIGLGSRLIESGIPGAKVTREFAPDGLRCTVALPVPAVVPA